MRGAPTSFPNGLLVVGCTGFFVGSVLLEKACVGAVERFFFAASRYVSSGRGGVNWRCSFGERLSALCRLVFFGGGMLWSALEGSRICSCSSCRCAVRRLLLDCFRWGLIQLFARGFRRWRCVRFRVRVNGVLLLFAGLKKSVEWRTLSLTWGPMNKKVDKIEVEQKVWWNPSTCVKLCIWAAL